jgi:hypothetical protein
VQKYLKSNIPIAFLSLGRYPCFKGSLEPEENATMKHAWVAIAALALASTANAGSYLFNTFSGVSLDPGTVDIGNHCDDCTTTIALPFTYQLFGSLFNSVVVSSNGNLQFTGNNTSFSSSGVPNGSFGMTIFGYQDDLITSGAGNGIFTSLTGGGTIFNIEWRTSYFGRVGSADFEIQLLQGTTQFNVIYASTIDSGNFETIGVQSGSGDNTQFSFDSATVPNGTKINFCGHETLVTPEPTSASLLLLGGGLLIAAGRLRKRVRG